ncbi:MAG TPA: Hsp20/alpha crystallin family protein [Candidatus Omnitrophota bacterium]|nr:Hsp20/alpha crystallin family protein [Candidatus Omnitrophota bacterium]
MPAKDVIKQDDREETRVITPLVNIHEKEKEITVDAEMPGLTKEDLSIQIEGEVLNLSGRQKENVPEGYTVLYRERFPIEYRRTFVLGAEIDREGIKAFYENGVLNLRLPKTERARPKTVKID